MVNGLEKIPFLQRNQFVEDIYNAKFKEEPSGYQQLSDKDIEAVILHAVSSNGLPGEEQGIRASVNKQYHLRLYGPNGFYLEFAGSETDP